MTNKERITGYIDTINNVSCRKYGFYLEPVFTTTTVGNGYHIDLKIYVHFILPNGKKNFKLNNTILTMSHSFTKFSASNEENSYYAEIYNELLKYMAFCNPTDLLIIDSNGGYTLTYRDFFNSNFVAFAIANLPITYE